MYNNPYYNSSFNIERLNRQKEEIDNLIKTYQNMNNQPPVNNFINTSQNQQPQRDLAEVRVLNENEDVNNLYVSNKTIFINDKLMVIKGIDGSLEKWEIKKIYPIDKKDEKINQLEDEIKKLKEMINNEPTKSTSTNRECDKPATNVDANANSKSKTSRKPIPVETDNGTMQKLGYNFNKIDFYITANMMMNDYHDLVKDDEILALKMARDWLDDSDAVNNKLYEYWKYIAK